MTDVPSHIAQDTLDLSTLAPDEAIAKARESAQELAALDDRIKKGEQLLKDLKKRRQEIAMRELPAIFDRASTDLIGVPDANVDVKVVPYYHANIEADWPEDRRQRGFEWLESNGHGDIIACTVSVMFRRGELEKARQLEQIIRDSPIGNSHAVNRSEGVPWNTLTALVREQIESGQVVDLEAVGATVGRTAKIVKRRN